MLFLVVLILLFGLMMWLTLYPLGFPKTLLKLQSIDDLNFKLLLLGIATLNFFAAFVLEVGHPRVGTGGVRDTRCPFGSVPAIIFRELWAPREQGSPWRWLCPLLELPQPPQNPFPPSCLSFRLPWTTACSAASASCAEKKRPRSFSRGWRRS